ncbi:MAG: ATP-binding protein, partial [Planctomycetota bacterium]
MKTLPQAARAFVQQAREVVGVARHGPREVASVVIAMGLFWIAQNLSGWLEFLEEWLEPWHGIEVLTVACYVGAIGLVVYAVYQIWKQVRPPALPPPEDRPAAVKGPMAFTEEDGPLFRRLGREAELTRLLSLVQDDQVPLVVVMGASGAGKTSLLRAGLAPALDEKGISYHYWEA